MHACSVVNCNIDKVTLNNYVYNLSLLLCLSYLTNNTK